MTANIAQFDTVRTAAIASITSAYTRLGSIFGHSMRILHFTNDSNGTYMISTDGVNDMVPLIGNTFDLYDITSDQSTNESFKYPANTQIWIKYLIAPTSTSGVQTDTVYLTCLYGRGE